MSQNPRALKLADRIQQITAELLNGKIKDPRLGYVTVTDVRVTGDLQHATVFYTVLGEPEERESTAAALASATGMIRSEIGKQTATRLTPSVEFILDAVPEAVQSIEEALARASQHDAEVAALAASATYAGEAEPYRATPQEVPEDEVTPRSDDQA